MKSLAKTAVKYRQLIWVLAWKNMVLRYKQAYLGLAWAILRPLMLMLIFCIVRTFVGIESEEDIPYAVLTFAALLPWVLFQDATSDGVHSIVYNANLIRKIYFPREVFPLTAVLTKLLEFGINAAILAGMMAYFGMTPTIQLLWVPMIILYIVLVSLTLSLVGAALHVYVRDVGAALPTLLSLLMYVSPVIYPLSLVKRALIEKQAAGNWSELLYGLYTANPLVGAIDAFQRVVLKGLPPDLSALLPGMVVTLALLPISYLMFKGAEAYFADVV